MSFAFKKKKGSSCNKRNIETNNFKKKKINFLSELVEKCCEFEPNKRIEFKTICNLIEEHSPNLAQQPNQKNNTNQNENEYKITTAQQQADYNILSPQQLCKGIQKLKVKFQIVDFQLYY